MHPCKYTGSIFILRIIKRILHSVNGSKSTVLWWYAFDFFLVYFFAKLNYARCLLLAVASLGIRSTFVGAVDGMDLASQRLLPQQR